MYLQLALDRLTQEQCFEILHETASAVDWVEIGTGVIKEYGMAIVREIKKAFPDKTIVADMKTCDAGRHEAVQAYEAGADITTVMAFSADKTIKDAIHAAQQYGKQVMVDLLGVTDRKRIAELKALGVDLVSLHLGKDMPKEGAFETGFFQLVRGFPELRVAVAGGITLVTLPAVLKERPEIIIVGSGITKAGHRLATASKIKEMMKQYENNHRNG